jgi:hypothetical protein
MYKSCKWSSLKCFTSFGWKSFDRLTIGLQAFGLQTFGIQTFGLQTFGLQTFGLQTFGLQTFGLQTFGLQTFWPTDIWPTDIWPADIWPTDICPADIWPADIWQIQCLLLKAMISISPFGQQSIAIFVLLASRRNVGRSSGFRWKDVKPSEDWVGLPLHKVTVAGACTIKTLRIRNVKTHSKLVCLFAQACACCPSQRDTSLLWNLSLSRKVRICNVL